MKWTYDKNKERSDRIFSIKNDIEKWEKFISKKCNNWKWSTNAELWRLLTWTLEQYRREQFKIEYPTIPIELLCKLWVWEEHLWFKWDLSYRLYKTLNFYIDNYENG